MACFSSSWKQGYPQRLSPSISRTFTFGENWTSVVQLNSEFSMPSSVPWCFYGAEKWCASAATLTVVDVFQFKSLKRIYYLWLLFGSAEGDVTLNQKTLCVSRLRVITLKFQDTTASATMTACGCLQVGLLMSAAMTLYLLIRLLATLTICNCNYF